MTILEELEELKELRKQAIEKCNTDREQFSLVEQGDIQEIIQDYRSKNYYYPETMPDSFIGVVKQIYIELQDTRNMAA